MTWILGFLLAAFVTIEANGQTEGEKRNAAKFIREVDTISKTLAPSGDQTSADAMRLLKDDYKAFCAVASHWNTKAKVHLKDFIDSKVSNASTDSRFSERAFREIDAAVRTYYWDNWNAIGSMIHGRLR